MVSMKLDKMYFHLKGQTIVDPTGRKYNETMSSIESENQPPLPPCSHYYLTHVAS